MIIKLKYEHRQKNTLVRLWMGEPPGELAMMGTLLMSREQFNVFSQCVKDGVLFQPDVRVILSDEADGSSRHYPKSKPPE